MSLKKISIKHAMALLQAAGAADVEIVADEAAADKDFDVDDTLSEIDTSRRKVLQPLIEQEIRPTIESSITGKISGAFRSAIKRTFKAAGLTEADLKDLKTEEEMLAVGLQKYDATMGKDTAELREEITAMGKTHEQAMTEKEAAHALQLETLNGKYADRDIKDALLGDVNKAPKKAGDAVFLTEGFMDYLKKKHHLVYDETEKAVKLRSLENKEAPVLNEKKTKELVPADFLSEYLEKVGALSKDNRHVPPGSNPPGNNNVVVVTDPPTDGNTLADVNKNMMQTLESDE